VDKLRGKVALVTGAARGQGRSHAVALAAEGAAVIAIDLCREVESAPYSMSTPQDLTETVRQVEALDRRIVAAQVDIRDLSALSDAVKRGVSELGRLDVVVANAGIYSAAPTWEMSEAVWDEMIEINLTGQWKTIRAAVPALIATGDGGSIVITSSMAAFSASENMAHYAAAKTGLIGMMRVLAKELAPHNIRVNTVHPTTVATDMVLNESTYRLFRPDLDNPTRADFEEVSRTLHQFGVPAIEPVDVSNAVLYLVTDAGRFVTGTTLVIDAGRGL
jgi:SDR family mycofactocin-dependent oxidoreductase